MELTTAQKTTLKAAILADALAVASGIPTLSAATVINITDTTATPRVTVTF